MRKAIVKKQSRQVGIASASRSAYTEHFVFRYVNDAIPHEGLGFQTQSTQLTSRLYWPSHALALELKQLPYAFSKVSWHCKGTPFRRIMCETSACMSVDLSEAKWTFT